VVEGEEGKFAYILWTRQASPDTMQTSTAGKVRRAHSGRLEIGTDILLVNGTEVVKDDVQIKDFDCFKTGVVVFWTVENNWAFESRIHERTRIKDTEFPGR
jgi:hypothetical protein